MLLSSGLSAPNLLRGDGTSEPGECALDHPAPCDDDEARHTGRAPHDLDIRAVECLHCIPDAIA